MRSSFIVALCVAVCVGLAPAQDAAKKEAPAAKKKANPNALPKTWRTSLQWRAIGPANMGGRITSLAVYEKDPSRWWAATASGGLLKTTNNGVSFEHQFDKEKVVSIGDVAVAQSNPEIVWVGTGEANPRNSVSWGNGAYKSVDGGKTWKHMGLEGSYQVSSVRIHPANPDVVFVGALGRLWGPNEERGLFRTTDGGKTWKKVLYIDDKTGVIDVQMHPKDPNTFLVATWERQRDGFDTNDPAKKWGPGSGLWRTTDGGKSFTKITKGLPACKLGRIGIDFSRSNPDHVYMVLESEKIGQAPENSPFIGITGANADVGARLTQITKGGPAEKAGLKVGDIVVGINGKTLHSYNDFIRAVRQHVAGDTVELEISRARKGVQVKLTLGKRPKPQLRKGQKPDPRRGSPFAVFLGGQRGNMQDQQGKDGHEYGGIYKSTDAGQSWTRINSLNPRPMYFSEIRVDPVDEKRLYVMGIRCWQSKDGGKTFTPDATDRSVHVDHHAMWVNPKDSRHVILGNDGGIYVTYDRCKTWDHLNTVAIGQFYHVGLGPRLDYRVYGGLQDNGSWGGPSRSAHDRGPSNRDWVRVGGGDGFKCRVDPKDPDLVYFTSQNGAIGRRHFGTGERAGMRPRPERGAKPYRFNWNTPFVLSHHNSKIYYAAGNHVFRSLDRGNGMRKISPNITAGDRGSATAFAESPRDPNLLYVGTDDGAFWMTKDGGHTWTDVFGPDPKAKAAPKKAPAPETLKAKPKGNGHANGNGNGDTKKSDTPAKKKEAEPMTGRVQRLFDFIMRMDENADGAIQKDEAPERMARMFERMDANKDGVLTKEEVEAGARAQAQARRGRRGGDRPAARNDALVKQMVEQIMAVDKNGDGAIQKGEVPEGMAGMFTRADTNKDGVLTKDEIQAAARAQVRSETQGRRGASAIKKTPGGKPLRELVPERRWVNCIEASRAETGRVYLVLDGHRSDDDRPHIYLSEDFGATWRSLVGNLPKDCGTTRVLREDLTNPNLLYLGTEFGAWFSRDRGTTWESLNTNLPTVAIHALAQHPRANEMVAATHGRSLWVLDLTTLRQMTAEVSKADVHLFQPRAATQWRPAPSRGSARMFRGTNPAGGAAIHYALAKKVRSVKIEILEGGETVRTLEAKTDAGLNTVVWNLRKEAQGRRRWGPRVGPGTYTVKLTAAGKTLTQQLVVANDPSQATSTWIALENEAEELEEEYFGDEEGDDDSESVVD